MNINRKKNAITGTLTGILKNLVQIILPFVIRTIFIKTIGIDYLGLNSLFTAILQVLNLAELGVSSALVYSMYKPIIDDDDDKICQLMNLYKIYYRIIGSVILGIGLVLIPFIPYLVNGDIPQDVNLYVLYAMNLGATVLSYWLFAHYNSLFEAHQRNDVINVVGLVVGLIVNVLQILALVMFKDYYLYLAIKVVGQILLSLTMALIAKHIYPNYRPCGTLPKKEQKDINQRVKDVFITKIAGVVNNSADSLVISALLGLSLLAVYQNYYFVISSLMAIFQIFFNACLAGVGNSLITQDKDQNCKLLYNITFIVFAGLNFCSVCLLCLYQPFMELWTGKEGVLPFSFVILFVIYLYAEEAPRTLAMFKDAGGIWKQDRLRPLTAAVVNVVLNLVLTPYIGLYGIIISTIFALLFIAMPWAIYNTNKYLFRIGVKKYVTKLAMYTIVIAINSGLLGFICSYISFDNLWITIAIRLVICILLGNGVFLFCFMCIDESKYLMQTVKKILRKKE